MREALTRIRRAALPFKGRCTLAQSVTGSSRAPARHGGGQRAALLPGLRRGPQSFRPGRERLHERAEGVHVVGVRGWDVLTVYNNV